VQRVPLAWPAERARHGVAASEIPGQRAGRARGSPRSHARRRKSLRAQRRRDDGAVSQSRGQRHRSRCARGLPDEAPTMTRQRLVAIALACVAFGAGAQDRLPPIPTAELTEQQAQAVAEFKAARGQVTGPWIALLRSPELMKRTRGLSDYLRFESILPGYLREFVILMTARQWGQSYE